MERRLFWDLFREFYRDYRDSDIPALVAFGQAKWDFSRVCPKGYRFLFG